MSADQGRTIIRIERQSSGWVGGAIGAARTTRNLQKLRAELESNPSLRLEFLTASARVDLTSRVGSQPRRFLPRS